MILAVSVSLVGCGTSSRGCGDDFEYQARIDAFAIDTGEALWGNELGWVSPDLQLALTDGARLYRLNPEGIVAIDRAGAVAWDRPLPLATEDLGQRLVRPVLDPGGMLIVVTEDRRVVAISAEDGEQQWTRKLPAEASSNVTLDAGVLFVAQPPSIVAWDVATGETNWTLERGSRGADRISAAGGLVFTRVDEVTRIRAHDASSGEERWTASPRGNTRLLGFITGGDGVAILDERRWERLDEGSAVQLARGFAVDAGTGRFLWRAPIHGGEPMGGFVVGDVFIASLPGGVIFRPGREPGTTGYDLRTGATRWQIPEIADRSRPPAFDERRVYLVVSGPGVVAVDRNAATSAWNRRFDQEKVTAVAAQEGTVVVGLSTDTLYPDEPSRDVVVGLGASTGDTTWSASLRDEIASGPFIVGDVVVVLTADEVVACSS